MNRLKGKIEVIKSYNELLLIELNIQKIKNKSIILNHKYLNIITLNNFNYTISSITKRNLLSQLNLDFNSVALSSVITTSSVGNLNLNRLDTLTALIKTNQIILSEC